MILAYWPHWQPKATFFMGKIPKRPLNDVIYTFGCFYVFHKTLRVIHVIRSFRSHRIHF